MLTHIKRFVEDLTYLRNQNLKFKKHNIWLLISCNFPLQNCFIYKFESKPRLIRHRLFIDILLYFFSELWIFLFEF